MPFSSKTFSNRDLIYVIVNYDLFVSYYCLLSLKVEFVGIVTCFRLPVFVKFTGLMVEEPEKHFFFQNAIM